jgi:putative oxidoreductase
MLRRLLEPWTECVYATLRIAAGLMFSFHGMQKILGLLAEHRPPVGSQLWFGGIIELAGGLLVALGLFTNCAAFLASGTMLVAYLQFHWKFRFDGNLLPGVNQGEPALLYSGLFLFIACRGAGRWSLDRGRTGCCGAAPTSA